MIYYKYYKSSQPRTSQLYTLKFTVVIYASSECNQSTKLLVKHVVNKLDKLKTLLMKLSHSV